MIDVSSLRVDYDSTTAVWDLDLRVAAGEVFGLVGPNGAGKTSTIKAIAGIIEPTYGDVKIAGHDMSLHREAAWRQLGYMPDFPPVYENLLVWEFLDVFAAAHLIPKSDRPARTRHWAEVVGLESKWDKPVSTLSRGMRQRLVLAQTLLHEPKVILLDEPASGMDPIARVELRNILKEVARQGAAVIISSHILTELSDMCTSVGIMEKGRMVVSGSIDDIRARLGGTLRLRIRCTAASAEDMGRLDLALRESPQVLSTTHMGPLEIQCGYSGSDSESMSLLRRLIREDFPIADFHTEQDNIEDIFMKIGAREVS